MNTQRDPDVTIAAWLDDGPRTLPPITRQVVESSIHLTPQRRGPLVWLPWRIPDMTTPMRVGVAAVIGLLALGGAFYLIGGREASDVGTEPTPTSSPSPAPTVVLTPPATGALLPPGTYTTEQFRPAITFTVPAGWVLETDSAIDFKLATSVVNGAVGACVDPRPAFDIDAPAEGVGTDAEALAGFIAQRTDLHVISPPVAWSQGGLEGFWLDIQGLGETAPEKLLFIGPVVGNTCARNLYGGERLRMGFLDLPDGSTLMVVIDTFGDAENVIEAGTTVVESFSFEAP